MNADTPSALPHSGPRATRRRRPLSLGAPRSLLLALAAGLTGFALGALVPANRSSVPARHPHGRQEALGSSRQTYLAEAARLRKRYEAELVSTIAADARLLAGQHEIQGPILGAACTPMERGGHPSANGTALFNCIAIKHRIGKTLEGARYFGKIDFSTGSHTYHGD